jgi:hypothetical protein
MHINKVLMVATLSLWSIMLLLIAGCTAPVQSVPLDQQVELFIPATIVVSPAPTQAATATLPQMTPTVACTSDLKFLSDITIPDGTNVPPGSEVDKQWEVENTGSCDWNEKFSLLLVEGPDLGVDAKQVLFPARAGTQAKLQITLIAPLEPGTYRSVWQAAGPDGNSFGDRFYVEFIVSDS